MERLEAQPRILNGLVDFRRVERLALRRDLKGLRKFVARRASECVREHLTYWKKFFRLQRQGRGRPPESWIETAASMKTHGKSWSWIAKTLDESGYSLDPEATTDRVRKNVNNYAKRTGIPLAPAPGKNSR